MFKFICLEGNAPHKENEVFSVEEVVSIVEKYMQKKQYVYRISDIKVTFAKPATSKKEIYKFRLEYDRNSNIPNTFIYDNGEIIEEYNTRRYAWKYVDYSFHIKNENYSDDIDTWIEQAKTDPSVLLNLKIKVLSIFNTTGGYMPEESFQIALYDIMGMKFSILFDNMYRSYLDVKEKVCLFTIYNKEKKSFYYIISSYLITENDGKIFIPEDQPAFLITRDKETCNAVLITGAQLVGYKILIQANAYLAYSDHFISDRGVQCQSPSILSLADRYKLDSITSLPIADKNVTREDLNSAINEIKACSSNNKPIITAVQPLNQELSFNFETEEMMITVAIPKLQKVLNLELDAKHMYSNPVNGLYKTNEVVKNVIRNLKLSSSVETAKSIKLKDIQLDHDMLDNNMSLFEMAVLISSLQGEDLILIFTNCFLQRVYIALKTCVVYINFIETKTKLGL
jgi:hypothetical protein